MTADIVGLQMEFVCVSRFDVPMIRHGLIDERFFVIDYRKSIVDNEFAKSVIPSWKERKDRRQVARAMWNICRRNNGINMQNVHGWIKMYRIGRKKGLQLQCHMYKCFCRKKEF